MEPVYKKAGIADCEMLVKTRIEILRVINHLDNSVDMSLFEKNVRDYYIKALGNDSHFALLVFDGDTFIGAGGISFYQVMPSYHNPGGNEAFLMNIYTAPLYRKHGIGRGILDRLVNEAHSRGVYTIILDSTKMGRPLYEKYGFKPLDDYMAL